MGCAIIKCFDTLSNRYVDVVVEEEISTFIKRSYWREDMQARRYYRRCLELKPELDYSNSRRTDRFTEFYDIMSLLHKLDERDRTVIILLYYLKLSVKEIAELLDISTATVYRIHKYSLIELRSLMKETKI